MRSILFTPEECRVAIANLLVVRIRGLRAEQVVRVSLSSPVTALATLRLGPDETSHRLDSTELMSAMLLYCRDTRIPLSTRSQKRLSLIGGKLALTTSINLQAMPPQVVDGAVLHLPAGPDLAVMHTT